MRVMMGKWNDGINTIRDDTVFYLVKVCIEEKKMPLYFVQMA